MRTLLISCVFLIVLTTARAEEKRNTLTPEQAADGWMLLFDGEHTEGLRLLGEYTVEDGVLIVGGSGNSSVRPQEMIAGNFEWRMEYRVVGNTRPSIQLESRGSFSGWSSSQSMPQSPGDPGEWRSLRITGQISRDTGVCRFTVYQEGADEHRLADYPVDMNLSVGFQVHPGTRLHLRNILLKADPPSQRGLRTLYVMVGGLVAVVFALVLFAYWRSARRRSMED